MRPLWILLAAVLSLPAGEPRLAPDAAALEELPQDQRWALLEAQEAYGKARYGAAAIAWEKFGRRFAESPMWAYAAWRRAEALRQDKRQDGAIAALKELIELAPDSPEIPEALLLLAECQAEAGFVKESVATAKDLLARFPAAAAAVPARLRLDDGLVMLAKQDQSPDEKVRPARLAALGPLAERIDTDPRNLRAQEEGLRRLAALAFAAGELPRVVQMVRTVLAAKQRDLNDMAWNAGRETIHRAWTAGADPIATEMAGVLWPEAPTLALERGRARLDWIQAVRRDPAAAAKGRGLEPKALQDQAAAELPELANAADQAARSLGRSDGRRDGLAWLAATARLAAGQGDAAATALAEALGRPLGRRDAQRWWDEGERTGLKPKDLLAILPRIADERERRLAEMDLKGWAAEKLRSGDEAKAYAEAAVAIAAAFEKDDPERAGDYIGRQAELLRRVLKQHDLAIEAYARQNRPPQSDFEIAETQGEKGDWKAAAAKLSEIAAVHAGRDAGASALVRLGEVLHRRLNDKAKAVVVLRQVCDDYPNTKQYGEAHRYLQNELGVTYTGGGGKRK
ncbi:MAG: Outer rane lipoprotein [Planctomycetota bacterium]|jgi:TolA-binding protein